MDARKYDRFADLLTQILHEYSKLQAHTRVGKDLRAEMLDLIMRSRELNDQIAAVDDKGWL